MLQIFRNPNVDFMRLRRYGYLFSGVILVASLVVLGMHWSKSGGDLLNYGIDFKGGTLMQVRFAQRPDLRTLRTELERAGFGNASLQQYGPEAENSILIRVREQLEEQSGLVAKIRSALRPAGELDQEKKGLLDLNTVGEAELAQAIEREQTGEVAKSADPVYLRVAKEVIALRAGQADGMFHGTPQLKDVPEMTPEMAAALEKLTFSGSLSFLRTESVGPAVGKDLRSKAFFASIVANVLILIYLWFRFELRFGVAAVICLVHDVIFITGVFAMTDREFDLTVLAAILTVIGYSVNDTIVVFDRVRQNLKLMKKEPLENILNASINQTLSRTVLTSGLTLLVVIALFVYGGEVLKGFSLALLLGIVEGTYSSIFVAAPLLLVWRRFFPKG